jgi:drug/metabolite transporter (DMT)-like permease
LILMIAAFAAVYIFWGSTYLAIFFAVKTIPPFIMAATRFLTAGAILYAIAWKRSDYEKPNFSHWRTSFIVGALLLLGGNGGVVLAEKYISSSLAALLVAIEPFWIVLLSWLWLRNSKPNLKVIAGLALGFFGVWLLISGHNGDADSQSSSMQFWSSVSLLIATFCWAAGSLFGIKSPAPKSSLLTAGMQMIGGGVLLLIASLIKGEWMDFRVSDVAASSWLGLGYLIVFGSLIGYTAYSWLLKNAKPERVATYAYVNPLIAVLVGWLIGGDNLTSQMLVAAGVIVGSVVLITFQGKAKDNEVDIHESIGPNRTATTYSTW